MIITGRQADVRVRVDDLHRLVGFVNESLADLARLMGSIAVFPDDVREVQDRLLLLVLDIEELQARLLSESTQAADEERSLIALKAAIDPYLRRDAKGDPCGGLVDSWDMSDKSRKTIVVVASEVVEAHFPSSNGQAKPNDETASAS